MNAHAKVLSALAEAARESAEVKEVEAGIRLLVEKRRATIIATATRRHPELAREFADYISESESQRIQTRAMKDALIR